MADLGMEAEIAHTVRLRKKICYFTTKFEEVTS